MDKEDTRPIQRERGTREMVKEVRYTGRLVRRKGYIKIRVRIKDTLVNCTIRRKYINNQGKDTRAESTPQFQVYRG